MSKSYAIIIQFVLPLTTFYQSGAQRSNVYKWDAFVTSRRSHNRSWQPRRHDRLPETSGTLWIHRGALTNQRCSLATGCGIILVIPAPYPMLLANYSPAVYHIMLYVLIPLVVKAVLQYAWAWQKIESSTMNVFNGRTRSSIVAGHFHYLKKRKISVTQDDYGRYVKVLSYDGFYLMSMK